MVASDNAARQFSDMSTYLLIRNATLIFIHEDDGNRCYVCRHVLVYVRPVKLVNPVSLASLVSLVR